MLVTTRCQGTGDDDTLPPIRTEVRYQEGEERSDDPEKAWDEWGETDEGRKNPFPRRQRPIEVGMDVNTIMGMAMKQPKVVSAVLTPQFGSSDTIGQRVTQRFRDQLAAAGIGCRLWFILNGRQVIANCETIRDGHMAKDYFIRQPEIMRTVIDNIPFTPMPLQDDDDDDDDDDSDDDNVNNSGSRNYVGDSVAAGEPKSSTSSHSGTKSNSNNLKEDL